MTYVNVELRNGKSVYVSPNEVALSPSTIHGLSTEEIGRIVVVLMSVADDLGAYELEFGQGSDSFHSVEDFHTHVAKLRDYRSRLQAHNRHNRIWQIDYQQYTIADFEEIIRADDERCFLRPKLREGVEALIANPGTWQEVADALGISVHTAQDRIREAVRTYYGYRPTKPGEQ